MLETVLEAKLVMHYYSTDDDVRIAYRLVGNGPEPVILVHGSHCTGNSFTWLLPYLPAERYTLLLPDLRGSGRSDKPATGYTIARFAGDLLGLLQHVGWESYTLVGHSTGGTIAQWMAAELDAALKALILAGPVPATGIAVSAEAAARWYAAGDSAESLAALWRELWGRPIPFEVLDVLVTDTMAWRRDAALALNRAAHTANFPERLAAITAPTLVIGAGNSPLTEAFLRETVVSRIASACYVQVANSNQYMHIDQAAYTAGLIAGFIAAQS